VRSRRRGQQTDLFITADRLPKSDRHLFYSKLNRLLQEASFDDFVESQCQPYYEADHGDAQTLADSVIEAVENTQQAAAQREIEEVVGDKGYHSGERLELVQRLISAPHGASKSSTPCCLVIDRLTRRCSPS
jgi:hypothetical protein